MKTGNQIVAEALKEQVTDFLFFFPVTCSLTNRYRSDTFKVMLYANINSITIVYSCHQDVYR